MPGPSIVSEDHGARLLPAFLRTEISVLLVHRRRNMVTAASAHGRGWARRLLRRGPLDGATQAFARHRRRVPRRGTSSVRSGGLGGTLGARPGTRPGGKLGELALVLEDGGGPALACLGVFADNFGEGKHPGVLLGGAVGVKVDGFAIGEADAEALFDEHVAFLFLSEGRFAAGTALAGNLFLRQGGLVVDQLAGFGEVDVCSLLARGFVIRGEVGAIKFEKSTAPVL